MPYCFIFVLKMIFPQHQIKTGGLHNLKNSIVHPNHIHIPTLIPVGVFALQVGMLPRTGTTDEAHMREDLGALEFELEDADVAAIEAVSG